MHTFGPALAGEVAGAMDVDGAAADMGAGPASKKQRTEQGAVGNTATVDHGTEATPHHNVAYKAMEVDHEATGVRAEVGNASASVQVSFLS